VSSDDELDLLRSTVRGLLEGSSATLVGLGELGLLGLLVPEELGGAGWRPVEAAVVADEIGRSVAVAGARDPAVSGTAPAWLGTSIAAAALAIAGDEASRLTATLDASAPSVAVAGGLEIADGQAIGALVGVELPNGAASVVVVGDGDTLQLVDLAAEGVTTRPEPSSIDTTRPLVRIELDGTPVSLLGRSAAVRDAAMVLAAATSLGSLRAALDRLTPYLSDRVAFGSPIASFQAIQHRIVDLSLLETRAGVAVDAAARALAADPAGSSRLVAVAHAYTTEHVPPALDECIQLTGGIGFTWEYPLHHELRRSVADSVTFGSPRASRERLLAVTGWA
jgi:alkylation response protein AidB-like acyl-CoA dehydrogenase